MQGPILGLDLGARRIGLAISDERGVFAFPLGHLDRTGQKRDLEALRALAVERGATRIVVGLPLQLDGRDGVAARAARDFARVLAEATSLQVELMDERLTTVEAERALREAPRSKRRARKQVIDAMAATLMLRSWLESSSPRDPG